MTHCTNCGAPAAGDAAVCSGCEQKLVAPEAVPEPAAPAAQAQRNRPILRLKPTSK